MEYRKLGRSGLSVSQISLGCMSYGTPGKGYHSWSLGLDDARPHFVRAYEAGINFFDTANAYSKGVSEEITGRVIRELMPRDQAVIATKVFGSALQEPGPNDAGLSRKHIMSAVDGSLRRLNTDYIDLYIIHRFDRLTPVEETMCALNDLVTAGKVRYLGASSMHAYQFVQMQEAAKHNGWHQFVSMQNLYNLVWREEERQMNAYCIETGVGLTPWSPLAGGFLTVDWRTTNKKHSDRVQTQTYSAQAFGTPADYRVFDVLKAVAGELGRPTAQVALAWVLGRPGVVSPIIGATKMSHLEDALAAVDIRLSADQLKRLDDAYEWVRALGLLR
jgi:aryl-alcohol dehydrogenase-like predicted oxidoreductase